MVRPRLIYENVVDDFDPFEPLFTALSRLYPIEINRDETSQQLWLNRREVARSYVP